MGYGLRYQYGMFRHSIEDGWQRERRDNWSAVSDPWEVACPNEIVEIKLGCSFEMHRGSFQAVPGRPSTVIGVPFDRAVVGYGGKTINTLRLWNAASHDYFQFEEFSRGDFVGAQVGSIAAHTLTRVLYLMTPPRWGRSCALCRSIFLLPARSPISCVGFDATMPTGVVFLTRLRFNSTIRIPHWQYPSSCAFCWMMHISNGTRPGI